MDISSRRGPPERSPRRCPRQHPLLPPDEGGRPRGGALPAVAPHVRQRAHAVVRAGRGAAPGRRLQFLHRVPGAAEPERRLPRRRQRRAPLPPPVRRRGAQRVAARLPRRLRRLPPLGPADAGDVAGARAAAEQPGAGPRPGVPARPAVPGRVVRVQGDQHVRDGSPDAGTDLLLRSLRLGCCRLSPPEDVELPALVTLHLINIVDTIRTNNIIQTNDTIQRIVDSCPRLADLTLEECVTLQRVSVLDRRLRRFAPRRGSRDPGRVGADDSGLQGGGASSTIEFCGAALSEEEEFAGFRNNFVGASHLHLHSVLLGCGVESEFFPGFPSFSSSQAVSTITA
jgi:hypothetical protein